MGCLLEFIFEVFVEGIFELIAYCCIKLMQLFVPNKVVTEKTKKITKAIVGILFLTIIIGLIFLVQKDPFFKEIGKLMTYIPLIIIVLQIAFVMVIKFINHFRN